METKVTGDENARGNTDDTAATEEEAGADDAAGEEATKLPPQELARSPTIVLTAPRLQEHQALR